MIILSICIRYIFTRYRIQRETEKGRGFPETKKIRIVRWTESKIIVNR